MDDFEYLNRVCKYGLNFPIVDRSLTWLFDNEIYRIQIDSEYMTPHFTNTDNPIDFGD